MESVPVISEKLMEHSPLLYSILVIVSVSIVSLCAVIFKLLKDNQAERKERETTSREMVDTVSNLSTVVVTTKELVAIHDQMTRERLSHIEQAIYRVGGQDEK